MCCEGKNHIYNQPLYCHLSWSLKIGVHPFFQEPCLARRGGGKTERRVSYFLEALKKVSPWNKNNCNLITLYYDLKSKDDEKNDSPCRPTISATCSDDGTGTHSVMFWLRRPFRSSRLPPPMVLLLSNMDPDPLPRLRSEAEKDGVP